MLKQALCFFCFFLGGLLVPAAQAQSGAGSGRSAWFACTSIPRGLENPVKIMSGEKLTELKLPPYMASEPVKLSKDGVLRMVRVVPDPANPEKPKIHVLAQAKVPENVREALIILVPLDKPEGNLLFAAKVQDLAGFKGGDRFYINLSDSQIRVRVGKTTVSLAPKQANIYESPALAKPTNTPIMYQFYHPGEKKWKILSASTIVLRPTRREICVFNDGSRVGKIKKHKIIFPVPKKDS